MELIESLSEFLTDELTEKRKGKLQRTFIGANKAANLKMKRCEYNIDCAFEILSKIKIIVTKHF